ncbi:hypothetical protein ACNOYE_23245 [Nannocystaceae bacterium ST9]
MTTLDPRVQSHVDNLRRTAGRRARQHRHIARRLRSLAADPWFAAAVRELLATSDQADELELIAHLELAPEPELYTALIDRLEQGPAIPAGQGLRTGRLLSDLRARLVTWLPSGRADLARAALSLLDREGSGEQALALACQLDSADAIIDRLARTGTDELADAHLRALALLRLTQLAPTRVTTIARTLAGASELERRRIVATLERAAPAWADVHRRELGVALDLAP